MSNATSLSTPHRRATAPGDPRTSHKMGPWPVVAFGLSLAFIYYSRNTGNAWYVYWGPFLMTGGAFLLGIPVYLAQRKHMTEPADVPSYPKGDAS